MDIYTNPTREIWSELCLRPSSDNPVVRGRVEKIIARVASDGDEALRQLSSEIDGYALESIEMSDEEIEAGCALVNPEVKAAIEAAAENIRTFHKAQLPREIIVGTAPGVKCIQRPVPIGKVGLYIPGGTAPLFSTVLMLAIPARIAGCGEVVLCSPARRGGSIAPEVVYAARTCGVDRIFKVGGAQAIAAMAYGTITIPQVDKIFGPGNQYVTTAKQMLSGRKVAIDMPAGPSEVMVLADDSADPSFVAADLLSQAEHGADSQVMLVCRSEAFARSAEKEVLRQSALLERQSFVEGALSKSRIIVMDDEEDMISFANAYAPEHLIVSTSEPWRIVDRITAAGSVFVGSYTPESAGDYASGTNHTLPTCGWAHSFSGVNIDSYMRKMTIQEITREGLEGLSGTIITMAEAEGLSAHAQAVKVRMK